MTRHFDSFEGLAHHLQHVALHNYRHNIQQACEIIGDVVQRQVEHKIGTYQPGVAGYPAWAPLAQSTLTQKARLGLGMGGNPDTPLYASGAFAGDVSFRVNRSELSVTVGTRRDYIVFTELGTRFMPARPIFGPAAVEALPQCLGLLGAAAYAGIGGFMSHQVWRPSQNGVLGSTVMTGMSLDFTR